MIDTKSYKISADLSLHGKGFEFLQNAGNNLIFLPENLNNVQDSAEFIYSEVTTDIRKIFRKENLVIDYLTNDKPILRARKSADWFGPTIFIGFSILSQNSNLINISLNLLSSYLYDFFKGSTANKKVKFDLVIENKKNKEFKTISYEGPIDGIKELEGVIKELRNDNSVQ
jgi:hypothetical protein